MSHSLQIVDGANCDGHHESLGAFHQRAVEDSPSTGGAFHSCAALFFDQRFLTNVATTNYQCSSRIRGTTGPTAQDVHICQETELETRQVRRRNGSGTYGVRTRRLP